MDTIHKMASSAMKAVMGQAGDKDSSDSHREPISGATGEVSKGEPYDAGNLDDEAQRQKERELSQDNASASENKDQAHHDPPTTTSDEHDQEAKAKAKDQAPADPTLQEKGKAPQPAEQHGQGEASDPQSSSVKNGDTQKSEHKDDTARGSSEQHQHHYVKTTGFAADGGDFDATKPGAGREADRLMHEKGLRHGEDDAKKGDTTHGKDKDKPSLGERIRNKFHKR